MNDDLVHVNPRLLSDADLKKVAIEFITNSYEEITSYTWVMNEDLLSTGTHRILATIAKAREWGNRILAMLGRCHELTGPVRYMANGKKTLAERTTTEWLRDHRHDESYIPKGTDAKERKSIAELENAQLHDDWADWDNYLSEFRSLRDVLHDKHKDLLAAKEEIRMMLWAVRVQGITGEGFARTSLERDPLLQQALGKETNLLDQKPVYPKARQEPSVDPADLAPSQPNPDLDRLLDPS